MTSFKTLLLKCFSSAVQFLPQITTVHNSVVHPPFELHYAGPLSSVPQFLFQSIKRLSKANLRFVWLLLFLLKMIKKYDEKFFVLNENMLFTEFNNH